MKEQNIMKVRKDGMKEWNKEKGEKERMYERRMI
jgi:hypothetical protein